MGAITVRYLQYLLKTGYFDDIAGRPKRDQSGLIASITCLSGANNGSLIVNKCGMRYDRPKQRWVLNRNGSMIWAFKMTIFFQNLFFSQNRSLERIKRQFKHPSANGGIVYELGRQYTNFFYDMNAEAWGWNRRDNES